MCVNVCYVRLCLIVCDYVSVCACVQDLVDMNFLKQGAPGYSNCEVLPGDRILKVRKESTNVHAVHSILVSGYRMPL